MKSLKLKRFLLSTSLIVSSTLMSAAPTLAQAEDLTILIWGVTWQSVLQDVAEKFTDETGIKVNVDTQASSGEGLAKLQAMADNPSIDLWFTTASVAERSAKDDNLFAELPKEVVTNLEYLPADMVHPRYAAVYSYPTSIAYRTDLVDGEITSWADLWDPKFERSLAVPSMGMYQGRLLMMSAGKDGGDPLDEEAGFAALEELLPNVALFYTSDAQARQALAQGEASVLVATPAQGKRVLDAGRSVEILSPKPAIMNFDVVMMPAGKKQAEAAQFLNYILSDSVNEFIAERLNMSAVNINSKQPVALIDQLPEKGDEFIPDEGLINERIGDWLDRYNEIIAQ